MTMFETVLRPTVSCSIAITGTICNSISLSYFLKSRSDKLNLDMLLLMLNIFDLVVCVAASAVNIFYQLNLKFEREALLVLQDVSVDIFTASIQCAGFTTLVLSVTRCIVFCNPFEKLRIIPIRIAIFIYVLYMLVSTVTLHLYFNLYESELEINEDEAIKKMDRINSLSMFMDLSNLALIISLVFIFNVVSMTLLAVKNNNTFGGDTSFRHAAITVLLLSMSFCSVYTIFVTRQYVCMKDPGEPCDADAIGAWIAQWIALPLNSTLNPAIYLIRSENMRDHLRGLMYGSVRMFSGSVRQTWKRTSRSWKRTRPNVRENYRKCGDNGKTDDGEPEKCELDIGETYHKQATEERNGQKSVVKCGDTVTSAL